MGGDGDPSREPCPEVSRQPGRACEGDESQAWGSESGNERRGWYRGISKAKLMELSERLKIADEGEIFSSC